MLVSFRDKRLELVECDNAHETGLPLAVIKSARRKLQKVRAAKDERDIRAIKSLRLEKLSGDREGQHSIRLNEKWRIVFVWGESSGEKVFEILEVVDYH